jgi:hypothetical protein
MPSIVCVASVPLDISLGSLLCSQYSLYGSLSAPLLDPPAPLLDAFHGVRHPPWSTPLNAVYTIDGYSYHQPLSVDINRLAKYCVLLIAIKGL